MTDSSRLLFALVLGVSATAALLAGLVPLVTPRGAGAGRFDRAGAGLWLALLGAWLAFAVSLSGARSLRPWHVGAAFAVATLLTSAVGLVARPVAAVRDGALMLSALRLVGLVRLLAWRDGWLPESYATVTAGVDAALSISAIALCFVGGVRARRVWGGVSLATLGGALAWQLSAVRPLPAFEALYDGFLLPLFGVAAVRLIVGAGYASPSAPSSDSTSRSSASESSSESASASSHSRSMLLR